MPTAVRETEPNGYTQYPDRDLEPKTYPEYPEERTAETARAFAEAYATAYQHNTALMENPTYDQLLAEAGVPDWAVVDHRQGYLVGVNVEVRGSDYPQPTGVSPTKGPSFYYPASAWYYLTPSVAIRNGFDDPLHGDEQPELDGGDIVFCRNK